MPSIPRLAPRPPCERAPVVGPTPQQSEKQRRSHNLLHRIPALAFGNEPHAYGYEPQAQNASLQSLLRGLHPHSADLITVYFKMHRRTLATRFRVCRIGIVLKLAMFEQSCADSIHADAPGSLASPAPGASSGLHRLLFTEPVLITSYTVTFFIPPPPTRPNFLPRCAKLLLTL